MDAAKQGNQKSSRNKDIIIAVLVVVVLILSAWLYYLKNNGPIFERNNGNLNEDEQAFLDAYYNKFKNPQYEAFNNFDGIPSDYQNFPEEELIKQVRSRIANKIQKPANQELIKIPLNVAEVPKVDGILNQSEWKNALKIPMGINGRNIQLLLTSDGKNLYVGTDAVDEITETGYDQLVFYIHVNLISLLSNERIHTGIYDNGGEPMGLRETKIWWDGSRQRGNNEKWKTYGPIDDWNIYKNAEHASHFSGHRQYEVKFQLEESGLHVEVPFAAAARLETDPTNDANGNFKNRNYIAEYGTLKEPKWFVIERVEDAAL